LDENGNWERKNFIKEKKGMEGEGRKNEDASDSVNWLLLL